MVRLFGDILRSIYWAFSTFSAVPLPRLEWREGSSRFMMAAFPLVGALCGVLVGLWCALCAALSFGPLLQGAGIVLLPILVSGGIHMDGYCDVCDALASNAPPNRRREILKDSHAGAFAGIGLAVYVVAAVACAGELELTRTTPLLLGCGYVLERALSGLAIILIPKMSDKGMAAHEAGTAEKRPVVVVLALWAVAAAAAMCAAGSLPGALAVGAMLLVWAVLFAVAKRCFGGMGGDLAGWFLCLAELAMLLCLAIAGKVM